MHPKVLAFFRDHRPSGVSVSGESMAPALQSGDLLNLSDRAPRFGDIVLYPRDGALLVHRVGLKWRGRLVTIGDAVLHPDRPVAAGDVIGVVKGRRSLFRGFRAAGCILFAWARAKLRQAF